MTLGQMLTKESMDHTTDLEVQLDEENEAVVVFCDACGHCSAVETALLRLPGGSDILTAAVEGAMKRHQFCRPEPARGN